MVQKMKKHIKRHTLPLIIHSNISEDHARKALENFRREIPGYKYSIRKRIIQDKEWHFMYLPYKSGQPRGWHPYKESSAIYWDIRVHPPLRGFMEKLGNFHNKRGKKMVWE